MISKAREIADTLVTCPGDTRLACQGPSCQLAKLRLNKNELRILRCSAGSAGGSPAAPGAFRSICGEIAECLVVRVGDRIENDRIENSLRGSALLGRFDQDEYGHLPGLRKPSPAMKTSPAVHERRSEGIRKPRVMSRTAIIAIIKRTIRRCERAPARAVPPSLRECTLIQNCYPTPQSASCFALRPPARQCPPGRRWRTRRAETMTCRTKCLLMRPTRKRPGWWSCVAIA